MRKQSFIALAVAIFLGLIAVFLVNVYLGAADKQREVASAGTIKVAVANIPLEFGTPVSADKVRFVNWPSDSIPPGVFRSVEELTPMGKVHVALRPMEIGEPILKSKLSGEGGRATLSALLPPDMRAVSIRITDVAGVSGFVLPGDRVDVLLTRAVGEGSPVQVTDILLQNIRVIAIDQDANDKANEPKVAKTATVEVQPYDAQKLALSERVGTLSLALRSVGAAEGQYYSETVSTNDLRGGGGGAAFSMAGFAPADLPPPPQIRRRARVPRAPSLLRQPPLNVEIVRGVTEKKYEVGPYRGS